ncbi:hypothetical protein MCEMIEM12_00281 [Burkholderiaceae bacterium]
MRIQRSQPGNFSKYSSKISTYTSNYFNAKSTSKLLLYQGT